MTSPAPLKERDKLIKSLQNYSDLGQEDRIADIGQQLFDAGRDFEKATADAEEKDSKAYAKGIAEGNLITRSAIRDMILNLFTPILDDIRDMKAPDKLEAFDINAALNVILRHTWHAQQAQKEVIEANDRLDKALDDKDEHIRLLRLAIEWTQGSEEMRGAVRLVIALMEGREPYQPASNEERAESDYDDIPW